MTSSPPMLIGIEIGGTKLQIVAGDAKGKIARRWRALVDRARGGPGICEQLLAGLAEIRAGFAARAIGVGFGGPIDWRTGRIARSHQIDGWDGFELRPWLAERTGLPVSTENDSNTAAFAEATLGAGAEADPIFYFNLGSGVGGGLVVGGRIFHGQPPGEAEFGHLRLSRSTETVESRCSGWAIDRRIRDMASRHPDQGLARLIGPEPGGEARHLAEALRHEDPGAQALLSELADDVAFALSHVVHLVHPSVVVLGGGVSLIGEPLRRAIATSLGRYVMEVFSPGPPIRLAALGEDAVPVGALLLASHALQD